MSPGALGGHAPLSLCYPVTHHGGAYADGEESLLAPLHPPLKKEGNKRHLLLGFISRAMQNTRCEAVTLRADAATAAGLPSADQPVRIFVLLTLLHTCAAKGDGNRC